MALQTERTVYTRAKGLDDDAHKVADEIARVIKHEADELKRAGYTVVARSIRVEADRTLGGWLNVTMRAER